MTHHISRDAIHAVNLEKRQPTVVAAAVNLKQQEKENADRRMADLEKVAAALLRILSQTGERKHYE